MGTNWTFTSFSPSFAFFISSSHFHIWVLFIGHTFPVYLIFMFHAGERRDGFMRYAASGSGFLILESFNWHFNEESRLGLGLGWMYVGELRLGSCSRLSMHPFRIQHYWCSMTSDF